jgi:hypothetical protein
MQGLSSAVMAVFSIQCTVHHVSQSGRVWGYAVPSRQCRGLSISGTMQSGVQLGAGCFHRTATCRVVELLM